MLIKGVQTISYQIETANAATITESLSTHEIQVALGPTTN